MSTEAGGEDRTLWLALRQTLVAEWRDDYSVVKIVDALTAAAELILAARLAATADRERREGAAPMSDDERAQLGERLHAEGFYAPAVKVRIATIFDDLLQDRVSRIARDGAR